MLYNDFMLLEIKTGQRTNPSGRGCAPQICVLKCDVCGHVYERNFSYRKQKIHRCSKACVYGHRKSDGLGGHGGAVREEPCSSCKKVVKAQASAAGKRLFCDRGCYAQWRSDHPEEYAENTVAMHTQEVAKKISITRKANCAKPGYVHSQTGLKRSEKTRALLRQRKKENPPTGEKNGMFGRKHTKEAREKMSDAVSQRIVEGRYQPYGTRNMKGWLISEKTGDRHFFRSSWEEATMRYLDTCDDVKTWDYEPMRIPYYQNDNKRWYVPDFIVTFQNGSREMWEVKPKEFVNSERTLLKSEAARGWCSKNDIRSYRLLTGDDLREIRAI